jgi:hypothetical protein
MDESELKAAIEKKVVKTYSIWTIGITDDPERRKKEHEDEGKSVAYWSHWKADTEAIARAVETYFIDKGMKGGTGGPSHGEYVYVF